MALIRISRPWLQDFNGHFHVRMHVQWPFHPVEHIPLFHPLFLSSDCRPPSEVFNWTGMVDWYGMEWLDWTGNSPPRFVVKCDKCPVRMSWSGTMNVHKVFLHQLTWNNCADEQRLMVILTNERLKSHCKTSAFVARLSIYIHSAVFHGYICKLTCCYVVRLRCCPQVPKAPTATSPVQLNRAVGSKNCQSFGKREGTGSLTGSHALGTELPWSAISAHLHNR